MHLNAKLYITLLATRLAVSLHSWHDCIYIEKIFIWHIYFCCNYVSSGNDRNQTHE